MDRLGEYIRQFAELLGTENNPVFKGIKRASTGLKARIPEERRKFAESRLVQARNEPDSRPAKSLRSLETMLGQDGIEEAQLIDQANNVVYLLFGQASATSVDEKLTQRGVVDGVVTGLVGADDTMHLHLRDHFDRDLKLLVRSEQLARDLLARFRVGHVRLYIHGSWIRTLEGWLPEASKCYVDSFETLDETPVSEVFSAIADTPGNGWGQIDDPQSYWRDLRGVQ